VRQIIQRKFQGQAEVLFFVGLAKLTGDGLRHFNRNHVQRF
jgi:hypothetical protein